MPKQRNYPRDPLDSALRVAQKIRDEKAGQPMNRLLVADALGIKPASSDFKYLLSSSRQYGLTEGTEKAENVSLTPLGLDATGTDQVKRKKALRKAVMAPALFSEFFTTYNGNKVPSDSMLPKLLVSDFEVPESKADEAAELLLDNGKRVGLIRDISGSPHIILEGDDWEEPEPEAATPPEDGEGEVHESDDGHEEGEAVNPPAITHEAPADSKSKAIFLGHGKKKGPLEKLEKLLTQFQIPYKVAVSEPNLGRPIPVKVRDTMMECGSAILLFTKDERFLDVDNNELWRPSENVVHELGAASFAYEDRIVIFKEVGIDLPTNFESIGYIEFEEDGIEAKTADLLKELIGFGLVKVTPTG
jgi:hypothetical protein